MSRLGLETIFPSCVLATRLKLARSFLTSSPLFYRLSTESASSIISLPSDVTLSEEEFELETESTEEFRLFFNLVPFVFFFFFGDAALELLFKDTDDESEEEIDLLFFSGTFS